MSDFKKVPVKGAPRKDVLASLKMAQIVASKPLLPAEILSFIVDYLAVPDLIRFARTSKRMQEMVYDDSRWVLRLRRMGCWNELEARKKAEQNGAHISDLEGDQRRRKGSENDGLHLANGTPVVQRRPTIPVAAIDSGGPRKSQIPPEGGKSASDGFDAISLSVANTSEFPTKQGVLQIFKHVRSIRGHARQEYGKVHGILAPYYNDITQSEDTDCQVFQKFDKPDEQAQMLSQLKKFSYSDLAMGWSQRETKLNDVIQVFENAALREFRQGYENMNIGGQMRQYAHVLGILNGGQASIELFIHHNHLITQKERFGNPMACIDHQGGVNLARTAGFFDRLSLGWTEEVAIIDQAFPTSASIIEPFLEKIGRDVVSPFFMTLFDEIHQRSVDSYLKGVAGTFVQSLQFARELQPSLKSGDEFYDGVEKVLCKVFEPHIDLYLADELDFFRKRAEAEVRNWDRALSEQAASTESFFMSNVNRAQDKRDFLSSFKKVVMMPVNILPSLPTFSGRPATKDANGDAAEFESKPPSRSSTPVPFNHTTFKPDRASTPVPLEAPTTELAARTAIMNSRLEGIRSLFSIEVALNIVHVAKSSLERAAQFIKLGSESGKLARQHCEAIFVTLLQVVGYQHVQAGFDKAVSRLSDYKPREQGERQTSPDVEPLVTFLELVNVGDLIQQMLDVFFEQELIATRITDRNDFVNAAVKEKKKFEQMLDERVAAGLNKGIDVLMDNVEYLLATGQSGADYNPPDDIISDVGPTSTSLRVIDSVSGHMRMLTGSTDKSLLDVFNTEVGLRLFTALTKHLKRQRISTTGAIRLIADMNAYFGYITTLKNPDLLQYFMALRELSQIYLIDGTQQKEMAEVIADGERFRGILRAEEVYEFAERRADWYQVKKGVERAMYGIGCAVM